MSQVREAAWAAQRAEEKKRAEQEKTAQEEKAKRELKEHRARVRKYRHLLDKSVLPKIFPDAEWMITDAFIGGVGDDAEPTLLVREKGADNTWDPEFRVTAKGVFIDYTNRSWAYGTQRNDPASYPIKTALDVGKWLKLMSDQMDEAYRRNPD